MCIAVYKPATSTITKTMFRNMWQRNPDGAGLCYRTKTRRVIIKKGFLQFSHFWTQYQKVKGKELLIHFRLATHGEHSESNTHPFPVGKNGALIHNGILSGDFFKEKVRSDTRILCEDILTPLLGSRRHAPTHLRPTLEAILGDYNKALLMLEDTVVIHGEDKGEWYGGCFFSNHGYKKILTTTWQQKAGKYEPFSLGVQPFATMSDECRQHLDLELFNEEDDAYWTQRAKEHDAKQELEALNPSWNAVTR